jgi:hypothetical protein
MKDLPRSRGGGGSPRRRRRPLDTTADNSLKSGPDDRPDGDLPECVYLTSDRSSAASPPSAAPPVAAPPVASPIDDVVRELAELAPGDRVDAADVARAWQAGEVARGAGDEWSTLPPGEQANVTLLAWRFLQATRNAGVTAARLRRADRMATLRARVDLHADEVDAAIDRPQGTVYDWEHGADVDGPTLAELRLLARLYHVKVEELDPRMATQ